MFLHLFSKIRAKTYKAKSKRGECMTDYEKKCTKCRHNYKESGDIPRCNLMCLNHDLFEPITNYDRIKKMSVEEMAEFMCDNFDCGVCPAFDNNFCGYDNLKVCGKAMKKYLESEVNTE